MKTKMNTLAGYGYGSYHFETDEITNTNETNKLTQPSKEVSLGTVSHPTTNTINDKETATFAEKSLAKNSEGSKSNSNLALMMQLKTEQKTSQTIEEVWQAVEAFPQFEGKEDFCVVEMVEDLWSFSSPEQATKYVANMLEDKGFDETVAFIKLSVETPSHKQRQRKLVLPRFTVAEPFISMEFAAHRNQLKVKAFHAQGFDDEFAHMIAFATGDTAQQSKLWVGEYVNSSLFRKEELEKYVQDIKAEVNFKLEAPAEKLSWLKGIQPHTAKRQLLREVESGRDPYLLLEAKEEKVEAFLEKGLTTKDANILAFMLGDETTDVKEDIGEYLLSPNFQQEEFTQLMDGVQKKFQQWLEQAAEKLSSTKQISTEEAKVQLSEEVHQGRDPMELFHDKESYTEAYQQQGFTEKDARVLGFVFQKSPEEAKNMIGMYLVSPEYGPEKMVPYVENAYQAFEKHIDELSEQVKHFAPHDQEEVKRILSEKVEEGEDPVAFLDKVSIRWHTERAVASERSMGFLEDELELVETHNIDYMTVWNYGFSTGKTFVEALRDIAQTIKRQGVESVEPRRKQLQKRYTRKKPKDIYELDLAFREAKYHSHIDDKFSPSSF